MIQVNKEEAIAIRNRFSDVRITITSKTTNHKKYYAPEESKVVVFIERMRQSKTKELHVSGRMSSSGRSCNKTKRRNV